MASAYRWVEESGATPLSPGCVLVTSFPSAGLAATVAAHYIVRAMNLPRVGQLDSPDSAPIAVIQSGHVNPAVRVYAKSNFGVVVSEFPPTLSSASPIAEAILATAESHHARMIVCLEGVLPHPVEDEAAGDVKETVWFVPTKEDPASVATFTAAGARRLEDGVIGGVSGALLVAGLRRATPIVTLLVSSTVPEGFPDHRAGAALIELLDRLLPEIKIDTKPLRTQAEMIERALRTAMRNRPNGPSAQGEAPGAPSPGMYQ
jgi:predicted ATP-grasp superfamily ATP-dependent carboligase